jgi:peroxiredoxin
MVATLYLLGCVLASGQVAPHPGPAAQVARGDWVLMPRLSRSQELVYRGTFTEEASGPRVQFNRAYRLETRLFVLETPPRGADVAVLTTLQARPPRNGPPVSAPARPAPVLSSARLERLQIDLQGKVTAPAGVSLALPLDGAPTLECGPFVEVPRGRVAVGQSWEVVEVGRPVCTWRVVGTETVLGTVCLKLVGLQQSDDWDRGPASHPTWRRRETVWLSTRTGLASRVERVIECREPARREPTQRSVLRYELESSVQYPGQLSEDRRQEILQALTFRAGLQPLLSAPAHNDRALNVLLRRITYHLDNQPATPYREAVLQVRRLAEAARRGETPPAPVIEGTRPGPVATLGQPAPDFLATEFAGSGAANLGRWKGRPLVLVFYHPSSCAASELLGFAQNLSTTYARHLAVVGLSVVDDDKKVLAQRDALKLTFPLLHGGGLRVSYAVETTPKIVLLDASGVVRGTYLGWGRETPDEVLTELRRWLSTGPAAP